MSRASKIGAAAYAAIPAFCREYRYYRLLTGKANLLLKQGLHEDEIIVRLIEKYIIPLKKQAIRDNRKARIREKRKRNRHTRPAYLRHHRRLKMVEDPSVTDHHRIWQAHTVLSVDFVGELINTVLEKMPASASPPLAA
jgi:hypothetical protein